MLGKLKQKKSNNEGFTIIEVMIVLAIAGLILLIVFLAVPALQRNSRNTQRKNDAGRLASLIAEYESNNSGRAPTGIGTGAGLLNLNGENFSIIPTSGMTFGAVGATAGVDAAKIVIGGTCSNNTVIAGASATRSVAVVYGLEGNTPAGCVNAGS